MTVIFFFQSKLFRVFRNHSYFLLFLLIFAIYDNYKICCKSVIKNNQSMAKFNLFIYFIILINLVMFATTGIYYENESIVKFSKLFYSFSFVVFFLEYFVRIFLQNPSNRMRFIISPLMLIDILDDLGVDR